MVVHVVGLCPWQIDCVIIISKQKSNHLSYIYEAKMVALVSLHNYSSAARDETILVAHLWTLSTPLMSWLKNGPHTRFSYSVTGLTNDLRKTGSVSMVIYSKDYVINDKTRFVCFLYNFRCLLTEFCVFIRIPRSLCPYIVSHSQTVFFSWGRDLFPIPK